MAGVSSMDKYGNNGGGGGDIGLRGRGVSEKKRKREDGK